MPTLPAGPQQCRPWAIAAALAAAACTPSPTTVPAAVSGPVIALVGGTVIDGNGRAPLADATLVITGDRITKIGPRATTAIPRGAWQIDTRGKYLTPGFTDANVHITEGPLSSARKFLKYGVTTVRDTHGDPRKLIVARDSLQSGSVIGARLLVAGAIIGMDRWEGGISHETAYDLRTDADSLRALTGRYLDKGLDFIKIAVTDHNAQDPQPLIFSRQALEAMIQEAHRRGKLVDSHTNTPEGVRLAVLAGVDVLQHPEALRDGDGPRPMPDDLAQLLASRPVICSVFPAMRLGEDPDKTQARENLQLLIRKGCRIAVATDGDEPDITLRAIEALVDYGMTPAQGLMAATRTGAAAAGAEREYGTLEVGKRADVLVLGANPLADIHNIRKLEIVVHHGYVIGRSGELSDAGGTFRCERDGENDRVCRA